MKTSALRRRPSTTDVFYWLTSTTEIFYWSKSTRLMFSWSTPTRLRFSTGQPRPTSTSRKNQCGRRSTLDVDRRRCRLLFFLCFHHALFQFVVTIWGFVLPRGWSTFHQRLLIVQYSIGKLKKKTDRQTDRQTWCLIFNHKQKTFAQNEHYVVTL